MLVTMVEYIPVGFYVHHRSCLLRSPVIVFPSLVWRKKSECVYCSLAGWLIQILGLNAANDSCTCKEVNFCSSCKQQPCVIACSTLFPLGVPHSRRQPKQCHVACYGMSPVECEPKRLIVSTTTNKNRLCSNTVPDIF